MRDEVQIHLKDFHFHNFSISIENENENEAGKNVVLNSIFFFKTFTSKLKLNKSGRHDGGGGDEGGELMVKSIQINHHLNIEPTNQQTNQAKQSIDQLKFIRV